MYPKLLLPDLQEMLQDKDHAALAEFCEALHAAVIAQVLDYLSIEQAWTVLEHCGLHRRVEIIEFLSVNKQLELVSHLDRDRLSQLVQEMSPDNSADLLELMDRGEVERLLPLLAQAARNDLKKLLSYPEDSAGSIMTTDYASLSEGITVGEALNQLRLQAPNRETIYYVYIVDEDRELKGFVTLRRLILAKTSAQVDDLMNREVISVHVTDDQEHVAQVMARYDFLALPVIDQQNHLVGIITHDDILDVLQEEATEDVHRLAAVQPIEDSYMSAPILQIAWKRGGWLLFLFAAGFGSAHVLQQYQTIQETYKWLGFFVPLVIATGGNAASQTATLVIRSMALGEITKDSRWRLLRRELAVGLILAACLSLCGFFLSLSLVLPHHALVVVGTVPLVVLLGMMIGSLLPIGVKSMGMDPAIMSTPLIASLLDICGIVLYFSVALSVLSIVG